MGTIFRETENRFARLENGARIESGIDHLLHIPENHPDNLLLSRIFFISSSAKKEARIRIPAGFMARNGVNYLPEFTLIPGALNAIGRGANQPYFGKQGII
jgi:hypothetical protein